jgi:hypothetical protein
MNVSAACPQCGAIANSNDKFCNTCGTPLNQRPGPGLGGMGGGGGSGGGAPGGQAPQAAPPPPAQPIYAPPPAPGSPYGAQSPYQQPGYPPQAQAPQYGAPARPTRCQLGHDIMPGMSYCAQGHPIALDAMQFAGDPNAYAPAQAPPPPPPPPAYGAPGGYGAPQQAPPPYDPGRAPAPAQGLGFGGPPQYQPAPPQPQQGYGAPAYPAPPPPQPVFQQAAVPPPPPPGQYAPPPALQPAPFGMEPPAVPTGAKQLRGFVVTFQTNPAGEFWPLYTGRFTVGRANAPEPADVPLTDATISSRHAAFNVDMNGVAIEDTNSTNGTYVNEEHIGQNGRRELRDGDRVRFGGYTTLVKILGRP